MKIVSAASLALLGLSVAVLPANAKEYNATYQSKANLKSSCAGAGGKFVTTAGGYLCNFKNGNTKECSNSLKKCLILTPK